MPKQQHCHGGQYGSWAGPWTSTCWRSPGPEAPRSKCRSSEAGPLPLPQTKLFSQPRKKKVWVPNTSLKFWSPIIGLGWGCYAHHQAVLWPQLGVLQVNLILTLCLDAGQKPVCRSRSNSWNGTWNNGVVPNCESSMSRLHTVTCLFNFYAEYNMWYARLDGIKIAGRNNNLRYADDMTLMAENKEGLRSLLMRMKEESENADLKLNI